MLVHRSPNWHDLLVDQLLEIIVVSTTDCRREPEFWRSGVCGIVHTELRHLGSWIAGAENLHDRRQRISWLRSFRDRADIQLRVRHAVQRLLLKVERGKPFEKLTAQHIADRPLIEVRV